MLRVQNFTQGLYLNWHFLVVYMVRIFSPPLNYSIVKQNILFFFVECHLTSKCHKSFLELDTNTHDKSQALIMNFSNFL